MGPGPAIGSRKLPAPRQLTRWRVPVIEKSLPSHIKHIAFFGLQEHASARLLKFVDISAGIRNIRQGEIILCT